MEIKKQVDTTILSRKAKLSRMLKLMAEAVKPKPIRDFDVWCDEEIVIPSEASSQPGQWRTSTFPFWKTPMKLLTPHGHCRELTFMKGCQVAATTVMIAHTMYIADEYPSPSMLLQPTKDAATDFSTQKWDPFVKGNPVSNRTLGKDRPKGYTNTTLTKTYPGGFLAIGGINNTNFIKSKSIRYQYFDEEDSYDISSKSDGNNIEVAKKRTNNYPDRIVIRGTTPKFTETSTNYEAFLQGSQERYYMPCPHCNPHADINGTYFYFKHELFKFRGDVIDDIPEEVYIECPHCGEEIHEMSKTWMMDNTRARWMSTKGADDDKPYEVDPKTPYRSFHLPSYYSPLGFLSWNEAFKDYFKYQRTKDRMDYQVYRNQIEGLPMTLTGDDMVNRTELEERAKKSSYGTGLVEIPAGGLILTMGVDVQGDRLEAEIIATGVDNEVFSVDYVVLNGYMDSLGNSQGLDSNGVPTPWKRLADIITGKTYRHESGCNMPIEVTFIDSNGHHTDLVHKFCKSYEQFNVFPCYGKYGWGEGYVIAPTSPHKTYKTKLYRVMKDELIDRLYKHLNVLSPGPSYQHFPNRPQYNAKYFKGLTAEQKVIKKVNGQPRVAFECPEGVRNEPIDVRCYAIAAQMAYDQNLSLRAGRTYPVNTGKLTFWKTPETPKLKRQNLRSKEDIGFMPAPRETRMQRARKRQKTKTVSKGI